ncbi:hypothetical protein OHS81_21880 [Streptomyces sp. NBC_00400]
MSDSRSGTTPETPHSTAVFPLAPATLIAYAGSRVTDVRGRTA